MADNSRFDDGGYKQSVLGYHYMVDAGRVFRLPIIQRHKKPMVTRMLMGILNVAGISAFILGILANLGDWKAAILFALGALYGIARFIVYCIKSYQDIRYREYIFRKKKAQQK